MTIAELLQKRAGLIKEARGILDGADEAEREMTAEENEQFELRMSDADKLKARADRQEKLEAEEKRAAIVPANQIDDPDPDENGDGDAEKPTATKEYHRAYRQYLAYGLGGLNQEEVRALQVGTDTEGGFLTPEEFETKIIKSLQENNVIRSACTVISTSSDRNIPVEDSISTAAWVAEEGAIGVASDPVFSQQVLSAYKAALIVKVSTELVQDSFFDIESYVANQIGQAIGILEETAFAVGDGSGKPTGIMTDSTAGVTAASASAITADEVMDLYYSVVRSSRARGSWLMKDSTVKVVRQLKDGDSQYLWQPGMQSGEPDMLLGKPVLASDGVVAITNSAKVIAFGDMKNYIVADRQGIQTQILKELYAANGQIGVLVSRRVDGMLMQADAIKHLVMAA